jgi:hypothetical protein
LERREVKPIRIFHFESSSYEQIGDDTRRLAFLPSAVCERCGRLARPAFDPGEGWRCHDCIALAAAEVQAELSPDAAASHRALAASLVQAIDATPGAPDAIRAAVQQNRDN